MATGTISHVILAVLCASVVWSSDGGFSEAAASSLASISILPDDDVVVTNTGTFKVFVKLNSKLQVGKSVFVACNVATTNLVNPETRGCRNVIDGSKTVPALTGKQLETLPNVSFGSASSGLYARWTLNSTLYLPLESASDANWLVDAPLLHFKDTAVLPLTVSRKNRPAFATLEVMQLQCCMSTDKSMSDATLGSAATLVASLAGAVAINWTKVSAAGSSEDRAYGNPAFAETTFCPCDLVEDDCDVGCCCDQACSPFMLEAFDCHDRSSVQVRTLEDECLTVIDGACIPFLAVVFDNSPFLGSYYPSSPPIVRDLQTFQHAALWDRPSWTTSGAYRTSEYVYGSPIATVVGDTFGYLSLPAETLNGKCIEKWPVNFLVDRRSTCVYRLTPDVCSSASVFSASTYLGKMSKVGVLERPNRQTVVKVNVLYDCRDDRDSATFSSCRFAVPRLRNGDDDQEEATCENVVVDVWYRVTWTGQNITKIDVALTLATVVMRSDRGDDDVLGLGADVSVLSRVDFVSESSRFGSEVDRRSPAVMTWSGNPGYDVDKPIWTVAGTFRSYHNQSTSEPSLDFGDLDLEALQLLSADSSGYCNGNGARKAESVTFGVNKFVGCRLIVPHNETISCRSLRMFVLREICRITLPSFVGRGGRPDRNSSSDFVPVIRQDLCGSQNRDNETTDGNLLTLVATGHFELTNETEDFPYQCPNVPNHLAITFLFTPSGFGGAEPVNIVRGVRSRNINSTWFRSNRVAMTTISLFATVEFIRIASNLDPPTKKFWLTVESLPCSQDSCWSQLFHPFVDMSTWEKATFLMQWLTVLIATSLSILCLTRQYWYWHSTRVVATRKFVLKRKGVKLAGGGAPIK